MSEFKEQEKQIYPNESQEPKPEENRQSEPGENQELKRTEGRKQQETEGPDLREIEERGAKEKTEQPEKVKRGLQPYRPLRILLAALFLVLLLALLYFALGRSSALEQRNALREQMTKLEEEQQSLQQENGQLSDKVEVLSAAVNQNEKEQEEEELKCEPTGYPLSGTATMEEGEDSKGNPMLIFQASASEGVLAAANARVLLVEADDTYGSRIRLDHGNGYETVYRTSGSVKVKEGDEITGGTLLAEMDEDNTGLGYQILYEGNYLDPIEKLKIYG